MSRTAPVVVVVGASSGIGRAAALRFASKGYRVVLASRDGITLAKLAEQTRARGAETVVIPTDISDPVQVDRLVAGTLEAFGRIDVWVSAASLFSYGRFEDVPPEVFRKIIDTNLMGVVSGVRAVLPIFRQQRGGKFVLVGSLYSKVTAPYTSAYVTSKHGLLGFAEVIRPELPRGVSLSLILPATIDTPIYQHGANYTGKEVHALPPAVSPHRVARAITKAAKHPRRQVVVGQIQRLTIPLQLLMPTLFARVTQPMVLAIALRKGPIPSYDGNVFSPTPESNEITGGWRARRRKRLAIAAAVALPLIVVARSITRQGR